MNLQSLFPVNKTPSKVQSTPNPNEINIDPKIAADAIKLCVSLLLSFITTFISLKVLNVIVSLLLVYVMIHVITQKVTIDAPAKFVRRLSFAQIIDFIKSVSPYPVDDIIVLGIFIGALLALN